MGVAAIEACYFIPLDMRRDGLGPGEFLTLIFNHASKNRVSTLKIFVLIGNARLSEAIEELRNGVSSNIRLGIRMYMRTTVEELAALIAKERCPTLYIPEEYSGHVDKLMTTLSNVKIEVLAL